MMLLLLLLLLPLLPLLLLQLQLARVVVYLVVLHFCCSFLMLFAIFGIAFGIVFIAALHCLAFPQLAVVVAVHLVAVVVTVVIIVVVVVAAQNV